MNFQIFMIKIRDNGKRVLRLGRSYITLVMPYQHNYIFVYIIMWYEDENGFE